MSKRVQWEVYGQGEIEIASSETDGMTDDEIAEWVTDGVMMEVHEQGNFDIRLTGLEDAIKQIREDDR